MSSPSSTSTQQQNIQDSVPIYKGLFETVSLPSLIGRLIKELDRGYGIKDLSNIEKSYLKQCAIECAENFQSQLAACKRGEMKFDNLPSELHEPIWLWLNRMYGVDSAYLHKELQNYGGCLSPNFVKWINLQRDKAHAF